MCRKKAGCTQWAWHEDALDCHAHGAASELHPQKGTTAAYMPNRTRSEYQLATPVYLAFAGE